MQKAFAACYGVNLAVASRGPGVGVGSKGAYGGSAVFRVDRWLGNEGVFLDIGRRVASLFRGKLGGDARFRFLDSSHSFRKKRYLGAEG